ncbi:MAG: hypothetical protein J6B91_08795 [Prevotella sp.]|nr:hypothetical protein [Prevotella sp.]
MKNIDLNRLWLTIKWDTVTNWKHARRMTLSITFGLALFFIANVMGAYGHDSNPAYAVSELNMMGATTVGMMSLFLSAFTSLILTTLRTKQQRISFLMQPASNMEKFISRVLYSTVGAFAIIIVGLFLADMLRALLDLMLNQRYIGSVTIEVFKTLYNIVTDAYAPCRVAGSTVQAPLIYLMMVLWLILGYTTFILGGTFFRRQPWLCTVGVMVVIIYLTVFAFITFADMQSVKTFFENLENVSPTAVIIVLDIILAAAIAFELWASYKLFCRMQVINNKWTNL